MKKIISVNFSYDKDSMHDRGIRLMSKFIPFHASYNMLDFNMPICGTNKPNGQVPDEVKKFNDALRDADAYVFAISEMISHYNSAFKSAMEWLVCSINENDDLNYSYSISHKPLVVCTFTPSYKNGTRHQDVTKHILHQLNADVKKFYVFNYCWDNLLPGNYSFVEKESLEILDLLNQDYVNKGIIRHEGVRTMGSWLSKYDEWNKKWNSLDD